MGIFYEMDMDTDIAVAAVQRGLIHGLTYKTNEQEDTKRFWPHGVTDGVNVGWFEEGGIIHFWGHNNPTEILTAFRKAGVRCTFGG
jgi:hypothetical protein